MYTQVTITKEDAANADGHCSAGRCLLATAVKRQFRVLSVICMSSEIDIEGILYEFSMKDGEFFNLWTNFGLLKKRDRVDEDKRLVLSQLPRTVSLTKARKWRNYGL